MICKTGLKNMVRPMFVHLWSRKPSNIICRTAGMCMAQCWMQRRPSTELTSVNYSETCGDGKTEREELDRETGQEQITMCWTRRKDGR